MSISKLFVKDTFTDEISEHSSVIEVYEFIKEIIQKDFCINLIYKNKHRNTRVCRRFFISDNQFFDSNTKLKIKVKTDTEAKKNYIEDKIYMQSKWFLKKTRFVKKSANA